MTRAAAKDNAMEVERLAYVKGAVVGSAATESSPPAVDSRYPSGRNYHNIVKATREPETMEALSSKKTRRGTRHPS